MLSRLAAILGVATIRSEIGAILGRFRFLALLLGIGAILWLIAFAYALAGLTIWLVSLVGGVAACAILAVVFVLGALSTQVIAAVTKPAASPLAETVAAATQAVANATEAVVAAISPSAAPDAAHPPRSKRAKDVITDLAPIEGDAVPAADAEQPKPAAPKPRRRRAANASSDPKK